MPGRLRRMQGVQISTGIKRKETSTAGGISGKQKRTFESLSLLRREGIGINVNKSPRKKILQKPVQVQVQLFPALLPVVGTGTWGHFSVSAKARQGNARQGAFGLTEAAMTLRRMLPLTIHGHARCVLNPFSRDAAARARLDPEHFRVCWPFNPTMAPQRGTLHQRGCSVRPKTGTPKQRGVSLAEAGCPCCCELRVHSALESWIAFPWEKRTANSSLQHCPVLPGH